MNMRSFTRYAVVLLGLEYLAFGVFGLFILARPAYASVMETLAPTQEILWAPVYVPKPNPLLTQVPAEPVSDTGSPAGSPDPANDTVDDAADIPTISSPEYDEPDDRRWIDVNLSEQVIYAYDGDVLVNSFIVSTGVSGTPTVTGEFNIYVKVPMQDMSGPGYYLSDVPWVMFFYDEYGFHGTYWHNNFGTPMSRGCVNLTIDDAKWLYDWTSVGTRVVVHY
jgi:lipoprotein-anchoring transpeptidase ErfK/SrfK